MRRREYKYLKKQEREFSYSACLLFNYSWPVIASLKLVLHFHPNCGFATQNNIIRETTKKEAAQEF